MTFSENFRRILPVLLLALVALLTVTAANAAPAEQAETPWLALYWNNEDLVGEPVVERYEDSISHRWENGAPATSIDADTFGARWTNSIYLDAGTYRFTTVSDDGIRVWVDGQRVIDNWTVHPEAVNTGTITLDTGFHDIRVDYFENTGEAVANLTWEQVPGDTPPGGTDEATISILPTSGPARTTLSVEAAGFPAGVPVTVGIGQPGGQFVTQKEVVTTGAGLLQTTIDVPAAATAGQTWRAGAFYQGQEAFSTDFSVTGSQSQPGTCGDVYIVSPGDWLSRIAERCGTTVDALLAANPGISDPSVIRVGQRLILPGGSDAAEPRVGISPDSGPAGSTIAVNAAGFAPNTPVRVGIGRANSEPTTSFQATTNNVGALETTIDVPATADAGAPWRVLVTGGGESALSESFSVTAGQVTAETNVRLRLRAEPTTNSAILDVLPMGTRVPVEATTDAGDWLQVRYDGQTGWVAASYTEITGDLDELPDYALFTTANIYLIALEDGGPVGCGDSVVPAQVNFPATPAPLTGALEALLDVDEQFYGQSGLYNALYQSNLSLDDVTLANGLATIRLSGTLQSGGACDNPRIEAQIGQTALQYDTVDSVEIFVNGQPLEQLLSGA